MKKSNAIVKRESTVKTCAAVQNIILCLLPIVCCIVFKLFKLTNEADMKIIMRVSLCAIAAYGVYELYKKRLDAEKLVLLIVIAGCVLRIGYTLYTHAFTRGHDIGMNNADGVGHWGYFYHIVNGNLPPSNEYQFYQPPLYYMVGAVFIRIMMLIKGMDEWGGLEYIPQLVSCVCSIIVMLTTVKIMDELKIKKTYQIIPIALLAVYPAQILAAGRMNNDSMVQMFMILSLYFTLRWHKSQKMSDIIAIALSIGFGMMTKISCGIIALVTGPVMIYHFIKAVKTRDKQIIKNIIIQLAVFAVICFPLGLWYGIRNYIKFDQPLNFVHELPKGTAIDTSGDSWIDRWIKFPLFSFKNKPYSQLGEECNIWQLLVESGVHGEFVWDNISSLLAWVLDYTHLLLMLMTMFAMVFSFIKDKELDKTKKFSALWVWAIVMLSYIQFNVQYAYSCTANFRYIFPAQIAGTLFLAYIYEYFVQHRDSKKCRFGAAAYASVTALFCCLSVMHFC